MRKILYIVLLIIFNLFVFSTPIVAQEKESLAETLEATVTKVVEEKDVVIMEKQQTYQKLELLVTKGSLRDKTIVIENGTMLMTNDQQYRVGDAVMVHVEKDSEGNDLFYITDYVRREPLRSLFIIFIIVTIIVAKLRGLTSLLGMGLSFIVIFAYILPRILAGAPPVRVAIIGSMIIIPISFFLSHGINKKTIVAMAGTACSLGITGFLASTFVSAAKLTGFASEESSFIQLASQGALNMKGLLLAGIIIGVLGVLDDITVSQSAIVFQLKEVDKKMRFKELYNRAMRIGQDHIASMVNTLVLVYTGASLPLLLLFVHSPHSFAEIVNQEIIADEIIRTLVGSIGLVLAVPITTFIAVIVASIDLDEAL